MPTPNPEALQPLKLSLREVSRLTGESLPVLYSAIAAGDLRTFRVGRRRFARPEAVRDWVAYLEAQSDQGTPVCYRGREALGEAYRGTDRNRA